LLFSTSVICDEENPASEVLELTDESITDAIANNKNIFIEFYAGVVIVNDLLQTMK